VNYIEDNMASVVMHRIGKEPDLPVHTSDLMQHAFLMGYLVAQGHFVGFRSLSDAEFTQRNSAINAEGDMLYERLREKGIIEKRAY
jgi:hypothetical protein